jgi:quercetin dioxygenase-like cupin family protein
MHKLQGTVDALSRRDLAALVALLAVPASGEETVSTLTSHVYHPDTSTDLNGKEKKGGRIFQGLEHSGFQLEMHQTVLAAGVESHPPHHHVHEEIIIVLSGTLESYVDGKIDQAPTGSVIYFGTNQMHKVRNSGSDTCRYYVLELRGKAS